MIVMLIKQKTNITRKELCDKLDKSDATVKEHLANLKRDGILERVGSTKGGHWRIIAKNKTP
jgi:ATP-dependent DNA helicase RecG